MKDIAKARMQSDQAGVTLLLAILVLSSILAIAFSLATIMYVEVRSSGDMLRSETSYYAADSVGEQALFNVSRKVNQANSGQCAASLPNCYSTTVGAATISSTTVSAIADPTQQDTVPLNSDISNQSFAANARYYYLYDPDCPAPLNQADTNNAAILAAKPYCSTGGSGYGEIKLTYLSSGNSQPLSYYLCQFNPTYAIGTGQPNSYATVPCTDPNSGEYWLDRGTFSSGFKCWGAACGNGTSLQTGMQQELILFQQSSNNTGPIYVQLQTFDGSSNPKGIPYFQETGVDVTAQQSTVGRKLRVIVPNR